MLSALSISRLLKKSMKAGCSKMLRCKACETMRNEAYFSHAAVKHDERNPAPAGQRGVFQQPVRAFFL
jgi:hypothetical protein